MKKSGLFISGALAATISAAAMGCSSNSPSAATSNPPPATGSVAPATTAKGKLNSDAVKAEVLKRVDSDAVRAKLTLFTINDGVSPAVVVVGYVDDKNSGVDVCRAIDQVVYAQRRDVNIEVDLVGGQPAATSSEQGFCAQA